MTTSDEPQEVGPSRPSEIGSTSDRGAFGSSSPRCCLPAEQQPAVASGRLAQTDIDEGHREGLTTDERAELSQLRRENRVLSIAGSSELSYVSLLVAAAA